MTPLVAQQLSSIAAIAGVLAAIVGAVIGIFTFRVSRKAQRGDDLEQLQTSLSEWAKDTITDLRGEVRQLREEVDKVHEAARADCRARLAILREDFEARLAIADYRAEYWKDKHFKHDHTPPPGTFGPVRPPDSPPEPREGT